METVIGGLRWAAALLGAYLVVSLAASLVVHGLRLGRGAARVVDAVTLPPVRRLVGTVAGVGVAAGTFVGAAPAGASTDPPVPVMRRLADDAAVSETTTTYAPATPPAEPHVPHVPPSPSEQWTVRPGDHFWRIAEEVLAAALQRPPTGGETDPYWRRLVAANRDRLADKGNPDLLLPGQVLLVPPTG